jgi:hypothetical protein
VLAGAEGRGQEGRMMVWSIRFPHPQGPDAVKQEWPIRYGLLQVQV